MKLKKKPIISIVIGVRDVRHGGDSLVRCLISLKMQSASKTNFEVIVINYGGSEKIKKLVNNLHVENVRYVRVNESGIFNESHVKNIGIRKSLGKYVLCTNADIIFSSNSISGVIKYLSHTQQNGIYQTLRYDLPENFDFNNDFTKLLENKINNSAICIGSSSATGDFQLLSKRDWEILNGYDERMVGWGAMDIDLTQRAVAKGLKLHWLDEHCVSIYHQYHAPANRTTDIKHNVNLLLMNSGVKNKVSDKEWGMIRRNHTTHIEYIVNGGMKNAFEAGISSNTDYLILSVDDSIDTNVLSYDLLSKHDIMFVLDSNRSIVATAYNRRSFAIFFANRMYDFGKYYNLAAREYSRRLALNVGDITLEYKSTKLNNMKKINLLWQFRKRLEKRLDPLKFGKV